MKTILLSGASGFIAGHIAWRLKSTGFKTIGISRRGISLPCFDAVHKGSLTQPLEGVFESKTIDAFIHCANHTGKNDFSINVEGTRLWAEQAEMEGIRLQIFLSSVSARRDSLSSYGRAKHELEEWFISNNHIVIRMGLVVGKGGLFKNMFQTIRKFPVLPLPDGGRKEVFLTGIDFLCDVIRDMLRADGSYRGRVWNLFQPTPASLFMVMDEIRKQHDTFCIFIPVPSLLIFGAIRFLERLPLLKLNFSSNNIIGLRQDAPVELESDFEHFGYPESSLEELVAKTKS